ncbi:MAG TPA: hypothetical protein VGC84_02210 [Ilumatobacteraceae bacterium]|jgi:hypothetical protein
MEPIQAIAAMYSSRAGRGVAFSALPDAPVQPYVAPRRRLRSVVASIRRPARRPTIVMRPTRYGTRKYSTGC